MFTVIFDVGNVIINYDHQGVITKLAEKMNISLQEVQKKLDLKNSDLLVRFRLGQINFDEFFTEFLDLFNNPKLTKDEFKTIWNLTFELSQDVEAWIKRDLVEKCNLMILSDTNEIHFDYLTQNFEIFKNFNKIYTSFQLGYTKDTPEVFEKIIDENNIDKSKCIFIDDKEDNVQQAIKAGISGMVFKNETFRADFAQLLLKLKPIPLMNKYAGAILIDEDNNLLLSKRSSSAVVNANRVSLTGGLIEENESPEEALKRELKEELNLDAKELTPLEVLYKIEPKITWPTFERLTVCYIYYIKVNSADLNLIDEDINGFLKVKKFDDLKDFDMTDITRQSIKIFLGSNII